MLPDNIIRLLYAYIPNCLYSMFNPNISHMDIDDFTQDIMVVALQNAEKINELYEQGGETQLKRYIAGIVARKFTGIHKDDFKAKYQTFGTKFLQKREKSLQSNFQKKKICHLIQVVKSATPTSPPIVLAIHDTLNEWERNLYLLYISNDRNMAATARYMHCSVAVMKRVITEIETKVNQKIEQYDT